MSHGRPAQALVSWSIKIAAAIVLASSPLFAQQCDSGASFTGPIVITSGGLYTGNWQSADPSIPAVHVLTNEPVTIINSRIKGPGELINGGIGSMLTVQNSCFQSENPNIVGMAKQSPIHIFRGAGLVVEHCDFESGGYYGIWFQQYGGDHGLSNTIKIRYNRIHNVDGRLSDGNGGYLSTPGSGRTGGFSHAIIVSDVLGAPGIEIAWNEIINAPYESAVGDSINIFDSSGTPESPMEIHDNYIQGGWDVDPTLGDQYQYFGSAITTDGTFQTDPNLTTSFVKIHDNRAVGFGNLGMSIALGHDIEMYSNRVLSSGQLADSAASATSYAFGIQHLNWRNNPSGVFGNNSVHDNLSGVRKLRNGIWQRQDYFFPVSPFVEFNNTQWSPTDSSHPTLSDEINERSQWNSKLIAQGISIGSGLLSESQPNGGQSIVPFSIPSRGAASLATDGGGSLSAGYARINPASGSAKPSGVAIFGYRQNGVLVSEASVPDSPLLTTGRIYVEISSDGRVNTGLAIANPNSQTASLTFSFVDAAGQTVNTGVVNVEPRHQRAMFLDGQPFSLGWGVEGALSFTSTRPVAVIALRGLVNQRREFLMTTLPVVDSSASPVTGGQVIPHFVDGDGWSTEVILVNPTDTAITGVTQFFSPGGGSVAGEPIALSINGQLAAEFPYAIPARASQKVVTSGTGTGIRTGSVRIAPLTGSPAPTPLAVFSYNDGRSTVTEAGVPGNAGTAFRMYVESTGLAGQPNSTRSGIAIANATSLATPVTLELFRLDGAPAAPSVQLLLPPSGQTSRFLSDFFADLSGSFQGILRVAAPAEISVVGLRGRYNERGDFLFTTTPAAPETASAMNTLKLFPHFANGGGFTTQFILFSAGPGETPTGYLEFVTQAGSPLNLTTITTDDNAPFSERSSQLAR